MLFEAELCCKGCRSFVVVAVVVDVGEGSYRMKRVEWRKYVRKKMLNEDRRNV